MRQVVERKGIDTRFRHNLVEIRPISKETVFRHIDTDEEMVLSYHMIHVTPPVSPPILSAQSPLANSDGWVDVDKHTLQTQYQGDTSCPVATGYGTVVLAEFDYDSQPVGAFPLDQVKERWSMWLLKKYGLPLLYWKRMLKGRA